MLKRCTAIALVTAMLATPFNAYAVTWGEIVTGIQNSSAQRYDDGTTSAKYEDGTLTVTGGSVEDVNVTISKAGDAPMVPVNIVFRDVTLTDAQSVFASDGAEYTVTLDENSHADGSLLIFAQDGGSLTLVNAGSVQGDVYASASGGSAVTVDNDGELRRDAQVHAGDSATALIDNDGSVAGTLGVSASEDGVAVGFNDGTAGELDVNASGSGNAVIVNDGDVTGGYVGVHGSGDAAAALINETDLDASVGVWGEGSADTAIINNGTIASTGGPSVDAVIEDDSTFTLAGGGIVNPGTYTDENGNTVVFTEPQIAVVLPEGTDMSDPDAVASAALKMAEQLYVQNGQVFGDNDTMNVYILTKDGDGYYVVYEDGMVQLALAENPPAGDVGEAPEPSEEMIRHWMEELRQEQAVGGVTGSPYLLKQMYMGYASHDLWLHDSAGEKVCFYERITSRDNNTKRLTLQVSGASTNGLTMRVSKDVVRMLRRLEFSVITILGEDGELYMEYDVETLWRTVLDYKLRPWELLVVGGMDDAVLRQKADLTLAPIEEM